MAENQHQSTYSQAIAELENILTQLRDNACDVDTLTAKTKRAAELIAFCRTRLTSTEAELESALAGLESATE